MTAVLSWLAPVLIMFALVLFATVPGLVMASRNRRADVMPANGISACAARHAPCDDSPLVESILSVWCVTDDATRELGALWYPEARVDRGWLLAGSRRPRSRDRRST
jgi:hypothetical protein